MRRYYFPIIISIIVSFLFVAIYVYSATTISTSIDTGGALTVTGASTLTGAVWATSTLQVTGAVTTYGSVTLGDAVDDVITATGYFTQARIGTGSTFGHIGTVGADELGVEGDIEIDGTTWFDGILQASSTALFGGAVTIGDAVTDTLTISAGTVAMSNNATTTIPNTKVTAWTIATSTTATMPTLTISTASSPAGLVGIATATPSTALDVNGYIRVMYAATSTACAPIIEGAIFYNDANNFFWGCNGSAWVRLTP